MKLYLAPYLAAISIATSSFNRVDASITRSTLSLGRRASFGLVRKTFGPEFPRGGSQGAEIEVDAEANVPEVLYLPGLLEASVMEHEKVSIGFFQIE